MDVSCECFVLSGCLCDELITRPDESCRLWCVVVRDLETLWMRRPWSALGLNVTAVSSTTDWYFPTCGPQLAYTNGCCRLSQKVWTAMVVNKDHFGALRIWKQRQRARLSAYVILPATHYAVWTGNHRGACWAKASSPPPPPIFCRLYADVKMTSLVQLAAANTCGHVPVKARMTLAFFHHLSPFLYLYDLISHYFGSVASYPV